MKKNPVSGVIIPLLLIGMLSLAFNIQPGENNRSERSLLVEGFGDVQARKEGDYVPIKWGLIVLGGFDYDNRYSTGSAIQKAEHWIQSRGVPYDVMHESNLTAPNDAPPAGKYSLQYSNGTIKYGVAVIILNKIYPVDSSNINAPLIYWAVGNGTNAVVFGYAIKYVPALLNVASGDVTRFDAWGTKGRWLNYTILTTFSDGIVEYQAKTEENLRARESYVPHTKVNNLAGKTLWYNCTSVEGGTYCGMMNYTYGSGNVFWNEHEADQLNSYGAPFDLYVIGISWETYNHKFLAHSLNFMFNQVQKIDLGLQGYKKWKGAVVYRLDQDTHLVVDLQDESALQAGWYYDIVITPLGVDGDVASITDGLPAGYTGFPSSPIKYGTASFITSFSPLQSVSRKFIVYKSTADGTWDRMKVDYNNDRNFTDDNAYGYWDNQTASGIAATYYWAYIDDMTSPSQVSFGYWAPMRNRRTDYSWWKTQGQAGYLTFGLHSWQHAYCGNGTSEDTCDPYCYWNGTDWIRNQTWIEQKFTEAWYEMAYCFGSTGYGYESTRVGLSGAGNYYPTEARHAWNNLSFGEHALLGGGEIGGFFLRSDGKPELPCGSGQVDLSEPMHFNSLKDAVETLFPVIGVYHHGSGFWNSSFDVLPEHTAFSNMFRFDHAHNILVWWLDARYMLRNTVNAYYKDNKIVLEYKANSTFKDYVWKFPIEYHDKYFNAFSDNCSVGKIKHFDEKYVYVEFSQGQGGQKLEATYGMNPHLYETSSHIENITQTYTMKNLTLQLWNSSGSINVNVNCTHLGQPSSIKINRNQISFNYDSTTKICSFNVTFSSLKTVEVLWASATSLSILLSPSPALVRFKVQIVGQLIYQFNGSGISNVPVLLFYSIPGVETWDVIASVTTGMNGNFSVTWFTRATGNYVIKAVYAGDEISAIMGTETSVALVITEIEKQIFSVSSNSTISAINFNSTAREITFTVTGPTDTMGYIDIVLAKSLVPNINDLKIFFDEVEKSYDAISLDDTWFIRLTYLHSTHVLRIVLPPPSAPSLHVSHETIMLLAVSIIAIAITFLILKHARRRFTIRLKTDFQILDYAQEKRVGNIFKITRFLNLL